VPETSPSKLVSSTKSTLSLDPGSNFKMSGKGLAKGGSGANLTSPTLGTVMMRRAKEERAWK